MEINIQPKTRIVTYEINLTVNEEELRLLERLFGCDHTVPEYLQTSGRLSTEDKHKMSNLFHQIWPALNKFKT